jgi:polyhydroxyalkanoate synthesis regulator phasin
MSVEAVRMVKRLGVLWTLGLAFAQSNLPPDVPKDHWAREAVEYLVSKGYIVGYPDGTFRGDSPVTRYQLALVLYRLLSTTPQVLLDDEALSRLRPLVRELVQEMLKVEEADAGKGGEDVGALKGQIQALSSKLDDLSEKLGQLYQAQQAQGEGGDAGLDVADLLLQVAMLKDRLDLLESGELPPKLSAKLFASIREVYELRLTNLEARVQSLEKRIADLEAKREADRKDLESAIAGLREKANADKKDLSQAIEQVRAERQETYIRSDVLYRVGRDPSAPGAQSGLHIATGVGIYDPKKGEGYEAFGGRTPDQTLIGAGYLRGSTSEGLYGQAVYGPSGAFGLSIQGWSASEEGYLKGTLGFRNGLMPLYLIPGYTGFMGEAKGALAGADYGLKLFAVITAEGTSYEEVATSRADPCAKTAYGGVGNLSIPFSSFRVGAKGSYQVESPFSPSCTLGGFSGYTYEISVEHDPTSKEAIVPNLGLSLYYGGHSANLGGIPFGLAYWGGKASYLADLGALKLMLGLGYKSFTPTPGQAGLPPDLYYELYPASGQNYGGSLVVKVGSDTFSFQTEVDYSITETSASSGRFFGIAPSLQGQGEDYLFRLAYRYGLGTNWDPNSPNPSFGSGAYVLSQLTGEGRFKDWRFSVLYDLANRSGLFTLGYQVAW